MEKHQHNIAFEEHHWDEALAVLKREERKQAMRRCAIFIPLGFAVFFGVIALLMTATPEAKHVSKIASNVGQSIKSSSGFVDGENDPLEGPNNSFAEDLIEEQINSITNSDGLVKSNTTRERSVDKSATNDREKSAATTANEQSLSQKNELGLDISAGLFEKTPRLIQTPNSMLELPKESKQPALKLNPSSFAMDKLDFKPISQSWRPGLKCKFSTLNKRQQEFRKWSLQAQQWTFYVGNAFTNDYASRANAFAFNPQLGFAFEQHIAAKTYFRIGLGLQQISNVFAAEAYKEVQASFGYQYRNIEIATNRLYVLELPVNLVYDFKLRHAVIAGFGMEYIGLTRNIVETELVNAFESQVLSREDDLGYLTGYAPLFWNAQLGYRYRFTRRASFDVVLTSGFVAIHDALNEGNTRINARFNFNLR